MTVISKLKMTKKPLKLSKDQILRIESLRYDCTVCGRAVDFPEHMHEYSKECIDVARVAMGKGDKWCTSCEAQYKLGREDAASELCDQLKKLIVK